MQKYPVSLLDWSYEQIKTKLFSGELNPGQKIVIGHLAKELEISPTPIKEALNRLVAEGFLAALPRRGFEVKSISSQEVHDILNCRIMIETYAVELAVKNFNKHPEIKKTMKETLTKLEKLDFYNFAEAARLEMLFHTSLIELTGNQKLIDLYNLLWGLGYSFYVYTSAHEPENRNCIAAQDHSKIYKYLEAGDVQKLEQTIKYHLEETLRLYDERIPEKEKISNN